MNTLRTFLALLSMLSFTAISYSDPTAEEEENPQYIERLTSATDLPINGKLEESEVALRKLRKKRNNPSDMGNGIVQALYFSMNTDCR